MKDCTGKVVPTWAECFAAGMSTGEAAKARGKSPTSATRAAKKLGLKPPDRRSETMRRLNADPEFAAARAARIRARHADPEFAAAHRERIRALNADPEFAAARDARSSETMRALNADPEFAAARDARMRAIHADPSHNPLVLLTPDQRADYDALKRAGHSRGDALRAIGRDDLVTG